MKLRRVPRRSARRRARPRSARKSRKRKRRLEVDLNRKIVIVQNKATKEIENVDVLQTKINLRLYLAHLLKKSQTALRTFMVKNKAKAEKVRYFLPRSFCFFLA